MPNKLLPVLLLLMATNAFADEMLAVEGFEVKHIHRLYIGFDAPESVGAFCNTTRIPEKYVIAMRDECFNRAQEKTVQIAHSSCKSGTRQITEFENEINCDLDFEKVLEGHGLCTTSARFQCLD